MKRILGILLMVLLLTSPFSSVYALEAPEQPQLENFTTNEEITEYNNKVDKYNAEVDQYNAAVDEEYNSAVESINEQNNAGLKAQEDSQKAHEDAIAANEAEQKRVEEENAKINEQNAAESERINKHNSNEDAKVEQSKSDKEKAELENASKKAQYDADVEAAEKEYEEAVNAEKERIEAIKAENEQIRQHNAEEDQRVADVDATNKTEKEKIDTENEARKSKYLEEVAQYEIDNAKYEEDYANYISAANQTDIKNEQIILNSGLSIAEYNMLPLKSGPIYDPETNSYIDNSEQFENLVKKAVFRNEVREENNLLKEKEYKSTIEIQEAEEKSGETYTLYLLHYLANGIAYEETITFDANDTVTIKSLAHADNSKPLYQEDNYGAFYNYQGDKYLSYYWYQTFGQFEYPPLKETSDYQGVQDKGNSYTFSYKNGKKYNSDSNEIYVTYYYNARLTCNIPLSEPTKPIEPTLELLGFEPIIYNPTYLEEKDETENIIEKRVVNEPEYTKVPDIYNPQYQEFIPIEHLSANLINVPDVIQWSMLPAPIKQAYLSYLDKLDLLSEPEQTDKPIIIPPTPTSTDPTPPPIYGRGDGDPVVVEEDIQIAATETPTATIESDPAPKAESVGNWALINLICTILSCIIAIALLFVKKKTDDEEEEYTEEEEKDIRGIKRFKIYSILVGIISIIAFILTEDITLPMILIDKWTILMVIFLAINVINIFVMRKKSKQEEDDDDE